MDSFKLPKYNAPDFSQPMLLTAPDVQIAEAVQDGVAPDDFHSTSMFPEYFKIDGKWILAVESRMDACVVAGPDGMLRTVELRNIRRGDRVILGRSEDGHEGIYVNSEPFGETAEGLNDKFAFRAGRSRETAYSQDYNRLYEILKHDRDHGNILWVMGPAFSFDKDAKEAMSALIASGFAHGLMAGNALATHDLEGSFLHTALGQDIYTHVSRPNGHYNHLDVINKVRRCGGIPQFIDAFGIDNGIMYQLVKNGIPYVLTGSIRDDGPLPEVIADTYQGQSAMRSLIRKATTIVCMATQLHTIATGNMTPCFRERDGKIRPLYLYTVDISEFAVNKLVDRGSLSSVSIVTNVQDFITQVAKGVGAV